MIMVPHTLQGIATPLAMSRNVACIETLHDFTVTEGDSCYKLYILIYKERHYSYFILNSLDHATKNLQLLQYRQEALYASARNPDN